MRWLWVVAILALVWAMPADAGMKENYALDLDFIGYACEPTDQETSVAQSPRADIMGFERYEPAFYEDPLTDPFTDRFADQVVSFRLTGEANQNTDPSEVLGDPRNGPVAPYENPDQPQQFDRYSIASLGKAGHVLVRMAEPVTDDADEDLVVWEAARNQDDPARVAYAEPFCVYGATDPAGPFSYVGLWNPDPFSGDERAAFDLGGDYLTFSGTDTLRYVLVLDSGQSELLLEPAFQIARPDNRTLSQVTFTDTTPDPAGRIVSREWDLVEVTGSGTEVVHTYNKAGAYDVCLSIEDVDGVRGTTCKTLPVDNRLPVASFDASDPMPEREDTVTFTDTSTDLDGDIVAWRWFVDDEVASETPTLQWTFHDAATVVVRLVVTDDDGATSVVSHPFAIDNALPVAAFTVSDHPGATNTPITFTDVSTDQDGTIEVRHWDFGDGVTSDEAAPVHAFTTLGMHTVSLVVTDDVGATASVQADIVIDKLGPDAALEAPDRIVATVPATFRDLSTDDGTIVLSHWEFSDGTSMEGVEVDKTFASPGTYGVRLTVTDDDGAWAEATAVVVVQEPPPSVVIQVIEDPDASRTPYAFTSVTDRADRIRGWAWDFGDGSTSADPSPHHSFPAPGIYQVRLTVTDDLGARGQAQYTVQVHNAAPWPEIGATADPEAGDAAVRFEDLSKDVDGTIDVRTWTIDGTERGDRAFTYVFPDATQSYPVSLTVTDDFGTTVRLVRYIDPSDLVGDTDVDEDGHIARADNCPDDANPGQEDLDRDGIGDACDDDRDNDGRPDADDDLPDDPNEQDDTDGDGIGDHADPDDDGDGIDDDVERTLGLDPLLADTDGDGMDDAAELDAGYDPRDAQDPDGRPLAVRIDRSEGIVVTWQDGDDPRITGYQVWRVLGDERSLLAEVAAGDAYRVVDPGPSEEVQYEVLSIGPGVNQGVVRTEPLSCTDLASCTPERGPRWVWPVAGMVIVAGLVAWGVTRRVRGRR